MRIKYKKALKELLKDRMVKLQMVRMDYKYYSETGAEILEYDVETLKEMVVKLETEMKAIQNWGKEKKAKYEKDINKKYAQVTKMVAEYDGLQNELKQLEVKEKDFVDYIKFLKDYLRNRRWREKDENTK